jgi:hypothetical protein
MTADAQTIVMRYPVTRMAINQGLADKLARHYAAMVLCEQGWDAIEEPEISYTTRLEDPPGIDLALVSVRAVPGPNAKPFPEVEIEVR